MEPGSPEPRGRLAKLWPQRPDGNARGNGSSSGIVEFDKLNASIQQVFESLDGDRRQLFVPNVAQLTAEDLAHRFRVDNVAVLLGTGDDVQVVGTVGVDADQLNRSPHDDGNLVQEIIDSGPRLVDDDAAARLANGGRPAGQADGNPPAFSDQDLEEIDTWAREVAPYVGSWWLLRNLKGRLGVFE